MRCLECREFGPLNELEGYCEITGRLILNPNIRCVKYRKFNCNELEERIIRASISEFLVEMKKVKEDARGHS